MENKNFRDKRPAYVRTGTKGMKQHTISLGAADEVFLEDIREVLGCTKAEAVRTAIRVYAGILAQTKR